LLSLLFVSACYSPSDGDLITAGDLDPDGSPNPAGRGPAPVNMGSGLDLDSPAAYVILAKTQITNVEGVTGTSITGGNLGLSPADASFVTGFSLMADPSNVSATSASVVAPAKVYAADYAAPTPASLTTAVLDMETAYADAASRMNPEHVNLGGGNLGGLSLAPGLYQWESGVTIPSVVTLAGAANDVWIFQVSEDLDLGTATSVVLAGGAQAKNVFWQVAGQVLIHAGAHFEGIILSKTQVTLEPQASLHGRLFAQEMVALDSCVITAP
jgi:hypothetical protein